MIEHCEDAPMGMAGTHCNHWWDDEGACCWCGDDTPNPEEEVIDE